jgi:hypothetical protein
VSLGLLAQGWASFLVPDALMQDLPDQAAQPVGNHADRLGVPEPRDLAAIEDASSPSAARSETTTANIRLCPSMPAIA